MNQHLKEVVQEYSDREGVNVREDSDSLIVLKSDDFLEDILEVQVGVTQTGHLDVRPVGHHEAFDRTGDGAIKFIDNLLT